MTAEDKIHNLIISTSLTRKDILILRSSTSYHIRLLDYRNNQLVIDRIRANLAYLQTYRRKKRATIPSIQIRPSSQSREERSHELLLP